MKKRTRFVSILMAALLIIALVPFSFACTINVYNGPGSDTTAYSVTLQRSSGHALSDVTVVFYDADGRVVASGNTDKNGVATDAEGNTEFNLPTATYSLKFGGSLPTGYPNQGFALTEANPKQTFKLSASLISEKTMPTQHKYAIGDVMYDFSYTTTTGATGKLSTLLQEKKVVVLNFWFINCTYCVQEFPDMQKVYAEYKNKVEILGLNFTDSQANIELFRQNLNGGYNWTELTFPMTANTEACSAALANAFSVEGCPTTVVIDREGVICLTLTGAGDESEFREIFEYYSADDYSQKIYFPGKAEMDIPDVDAPTSAQVEAAINNTESGFNGKYSFNANDDEYNWPWVVCEDGKSIMASNTKHHNSYAIMDISVVMTSAKALAFDYKTSTEARGDEFHVFVDGVLTHSFSGVMDDYKTLYAYVPVKAAGKYDISLAYVKDGSRYAGDDTVYIKNMRFVDVGAIDARTEIIYRAASGAIIAEHHYSEYITPVLGDDNYYHVGTKTGPLLLANIMEGTDWSNSSAWSYVANGKLEYNSTDFTETFTRYAQIANCSRKYGFVAVTPELRLCLEALTHKFGSGHTSEWLELCSYYVVYGGTAGEILPDPTEGMNSHNCYTAKLTEDESAPVYNFVSKETIIMPRGLWYKFVPSKTAVYRVYSVGEVDTYGWIFDDNNNLLIENNDNEDDFSGLPAEERGNFCMTTVLEKDAVYYILVDFNNVDTLGEFKFVVTCAADSGTVWTHASGADYVGILDDDGNLVGVKLGGAVDTVVKDGVYHVKNADGSVGSKLYINLTSVTYMFNELSIEQMLTGKTYYCKHCASKYLNSVAHFEATDDPVCFVCGASGKDAFCSEPIGNFVLPEAQRENGEPDGNLIARRITYSDGSETLLPCYVLDTPNGVGTELAKYANDILVWGIKLTDYTAKMTEYVQKSKSADYYPTDPDDIIGGAKTRSGFIEASEELVDILNKFIIFGDYSYSPLLNNTWLMLASYYRHLG